jgi:hypothetical protein
MNITSISLPFVAIEPSKPRKYAGSSSRKAIVFVANLLKVNPTFSRVLASNSRGGIANLRLVQNGVGQGTRCQ